MDPDLKKELDVLVTLRKVISSVVREITPDPGMLHPLSERTMEDVRQSFILIAAREKEITEALGKPSLHRPLYKGDKPKTNVVKLHGMKSSKPKNDDPA
ncbi:MAG TPA: segregation and condensation protein A [Gammaproteobacteria bacterium]